MARGLNKVMILGNVGKDPEIRYSKSGSAIANLTVATTEGRKQPSGEYEDQTEWHRVVFFGKQAETCKDYLHKGSKVFIEGRLQTNTWEDKDGKKNYTTEIIGFTMLMLDSKGSSGGTPQQAQAPRPNTPQGSDDLPF